MEAEQKKKKGGKGLSILSGRDLFVYKKELFVDDADAANVEVGAMKGLNEEEEEEGEGGEGGGGGGKLRGWGPPGEAQRGKGAAAQ